MTHKGLAPSLGKMAPLLSVFQSPCMHSGDLITFLCCMFNWWWLLSCPLCLEGRGRGPMLTGFWKGEERIMMLPHIPLPPAFPSRVSP